MNYDSLIMPRRAKKTRLLSLSKKPGSPNKGIHFSTKSIIKNIKQKRKSELKDNLFKSIEDE